MENSENNQSKNISSEKKPYFDYAHRSLDICAVCKNRMIEHLLCIHRPTRNLIVLAIATLQITVGKKHIAYPLLPTQRGLFSPMDGYTGHLQLVTCVTEAPRLTASGSTLSRAVIAVCHSHYI